MRPSLSVRLGKTQSALSGKRAALHRRSVSALVIRIVPEVDGFVGLAGTPVPEFLHFAAVTMLVLGGQSRQQRLRCLVQRSHGRHSERSRGIPQNAPHTDQCHALQHDGCTASDDPRLGPQRASVCEQRPVAGGVAARTVLLSGRIRDSSAPRTPLGMTPVATGEPELECRNSRVGQAGTPAPLIAMSIGASAARGRAICPCADRARTKFRR